MRGRYPKTGDTHDSRDRAMGWILLPDDPEVKVPPLPPGRKWTAATKSWWTRVWSLPQAREWEPTGIEMEVMLRLIDDLYAGTVEPAKVSAELRQWFDRFGLNPRAAQSLRWKRSNGESVPAAPVLPAVQLGASSAERRERIGRQIAAEAIARNVA